MILKETVLSRIVLARFNPGDDILLSLRAAVEESGIRSGLILNGIGSVSRFRVHVVKTTKLPPGDVFFEEEGPFDILAITGFILDGRVHAHITLSNTERAIGGHLEEGCRILTFGVATLAEAQGVDLADWDRVGAL